MKLLNLIIKFLTSLFTPKLTVEAPETPQSTISSTPTINLVTSVPTASQSLPQDHLVQAIIMVESQGNDNAIGDLHLTNHAYGCMQIRQGVCDQVNAHFGTHYKSQDCLGNRVLSIQLFNQYYEIFSTLTTDEDKAKGWNGGAAWKQYYGKPNYEKYTENLDIYWSKVQKYL